MKRLRIDLAVLCWAAILAFLVLVVGYMIVTDPVHRARHPTVTEEFGALIYFPPGHDPETPAKVLYWLHGRNMTGHYCPPMLERPNYIIVSPLFDREAQWSNYDLRALVARVESKYAVSERYIEGYSRGANGAVHHAAVNPGMFAHINALAGSYVTTQRVLDPLTILGGIRDARWGASSQVYADLIGRSVVWVDSTHDPREFYNAIKDRKDTPIL